MSLHLAVDFDQNDWAALYANPADAANGFGAGGVSIGALARRVSGTGAASSVSNHSRYGDDRAKYGKDYLNFGTGTDANPFIDIGFNGTTWNIAAQPAGTYQVVLWARIAGAASANTFKAEIITDTTTVATSAAQVIDNVSWTKFTVSGSFVGAARNLGARLFRFSGTSGLTIQITGVMVLAGSVAPDYFNCGGVSLLENITDYFLENSRWGLGFVKPYQYVAPVGKADLRLSNADKRFSPEYASGPLYGDLLPNLLVQIGDPDYGIWWTGWTDSWAPEPGTNRDKFAVLRATDARRFLDRTIVPIPDLQGFTEDERLALLLADASLPNTTEGLPSTTDGTTEWYPLSDGAHSVPVGDVGGWYGNNLTADPTLTSVLADMLTGDQGHLWCTRAGGVVARLMQGDDTPANYINLAQEWINIGNIETGSIINRCEVGVFIAKAELGTFTVWEEEDTITVAAGATESFRVYFSVDPNNDKRTAADTLTLTHAPIGGGRSSSLSDFRLQSVVVNFVNASGGSLDFTSADISAGRIMTQRRQLMKEYEDAASITANGLLTAAIRTPWVILRSWAKQLARYTVTRFKDARFEVPWVEYDVNKNPANAFACYVGASVRVTDVQTGHDDYYAVIGEQHTVKGGLLDHTVKLYLEPLYATSVGDTSAS